MANLKLIPIQTNHWVDEDLQECINTWENKTVSWARNVLRVEKRGEFGAVPIETYNCSQLGIQRCFTKALVYRNQVSLKLFLFI